MEQQETFTLDKDQEIQVNIIAKACLVSVDHFIQASISLMIANIIETVEKLEVPPYIAFIGIRGALNEAIREFNDRDRKPEPVEDDEPCTCPICTGAVDTEEGFEAFMDSLYVSIMGEEPEAPIDRKESGLDSI